MLFIVCEDFRRRRRLARCIYECIMALIEPFTTRKACCNSLITCISIIGCTTHSKLTIVLVPL